MAALALGSEKVVREKVMLRDGHVPPWDRPQSASYLRLVGLRPFEAGCGPEWASIGFAWPQDYLKRRLEAIAVDPIAAHLLSIVTHEFFA